MFLQARSLVIGLFLAVSFLERRSCEGCADSLVRKSIGKKLLIRQAIRFIFPFLLTGSFSPIL